MDKTEKKAVVKFLKALGWVGLLSSLVLVLPTFILVYSGELIPVEKVCRMQQADNHILWGLAYTDPQRKYKLTGTQLNQPEILALGNSRVMPFRKEFFNPGVKFYNAGGGVKILSQYKVFLEKIDNSKINFLLISLDDFMFAPNWPNLKDTVLGDDFFEKESTMDNVLGAYQLMYSDYLKRKFTLKEIINHDKNKIGFNAIVKNVGYRSDGSWYYGGIIENPESSLDYGFVITKNMIKNGETHYVHANAASQRVFVELDTLLAYCRQKNIQVLAFNPPFAPTVYTMMQNQPEDYKYREGLFQKIREVFNKYGFWIYDYSNPAVVDGKDDEFVDGHHAGERFYAKMAVNMADSCEAFRKYLNVEYIKEMLNKQKHPLYIIEN